jgi:hypothetical protein
MCLGVLALDRNYSDIRPRRPEGGPDGGRDIECRRLGEKCFGAVGFKNNVSDSPQDKKEIQDKFRDDVRAARQADRDVKAFVFFCNVDLAPSEIEKLETFAHEHGFSHVDIYWRERLRHALDSVDGLALRFQYLGIKLSDAEQAAFFARFGKELEDLLHGRFDRIEQKLDELEFARWKAGRIHSLELELRFKSYVEAKHKHPEHFRIALELQGVVHEKRSIILGGRDDFWPANDDTFYFGTKTFFWREQVGKIEDSWIKAQTRIGGGVVGGITLGLQWRPVSPILAAEFEGLSRHLHFTENLVNRLDRVRFTLDDYVFLDWKFSSDDLEPCRPSLGWPDELTDEESSVGWLYKDLWHISFDRAPKKGSDR